MTETPATPRSAFRSAQDPRRQRSLTIDGVRWTVRLVVDAYDRRSRLDLVFDSEGVVRRVRNYPDDWDLLPDEALFALSHGR